VRSAYTNNLQGIAMLINGVPADSVSALDRGLAYGDGIYRTVELIEGKPRLWKWQWQRLVADAERLFLPLPDEALLLNELATVAQDMARAVGKITLTRGVGQRGYAMPQDSTPTRIVSASAWGGYPVERLQHGVMLRLCQVRLARQPLLAGIKHLNRLENVLARSEWNDPAIHEGLLLDSQGCLVEATMSNLFLLNQNRLLTPRLDQAGVSGALRAWVFEQAPAVGLKVDEAELELGDLLAAEAAFLTNSLIGIWPVAKLTGQFARQWQDFRVAQRLAAALAGF
jgi:4-amino-4-deoxychorismate lyase